MADFYSVNNECRLQFTIKTEHKSILEMLCNKINWSMPIVRSAKVLVEFVQNSVI